LCRTVALQLCLPWVTPFWVQMLRQMTLHLVVTSKQPLPVQHKSWGAELRSNFFTQIKDYHLQTYQFKSWTHGYSKSISEKPAPWAYWTH
jgi:hypothetical protein